MRTTTVSKLVQKYPAIAQFDYSDMNNKMFWRFSEMLFLFGYQVCKRQIIPKSSTIQDFYYVRIQKIKIREQSQILTV